MRSRCANSAPTRPRFCHTPRRIVSISSGDVSGKAAMRFALPILCSGSHGPTAPISRPTTFDMRLRLVRRSARSSMTVIQPTLLSNHALRRPPDLKRALTSERHDDLAEHVSVFEPREPALKILQRHFVIDRGGQPAGHLGKVFIHFADGAAERAE